MRRSFGLGVSASLLLHLGALIGLQQFDRQSLRVTRPSAVELEVLEPPPPPPPVPEPPPPEPPRPPPRRVAVVTPKKPPPLPETAPPPPNKPPPEIPPDEPPPPVFGLTEDSVVTGDSPVAVPVGNTVMVKPDTARLPGPAAPLPAADPPFAPVGNMYLKQLPRVLHEEKASTPESAYRMGVGGQVLMRVGVDQGGRVRSVRVVKAGGHGFDEAATKAMWKFRFSPCLDLQGRAVDCLLTYSYRFQPPR